MRFSTAILTAIMLICTASVVQAGISLVVPVTKTTTSDSNETVFGIGIRFSFGDMAPELFGAVRNTTTDEDSDVTGIQGDVSIPLGGPNLGNPEFRVLGLFGTRDLLGQAGVGFDFGTNQPFASGGVQGTNVEAGVNVGLGGDFDPYVGVNTFGEPSGPETKTTTKLVSIPVLPD